jgi:hypothetical protein
MDALRSGARRIALAVMRGSLESTEDEGRPVVVFAGFGHYGFTSYSQPDDECEPAFQDCTPGLRCTAVSQPAPMDAFNRCVPDGAVARGQECAGRDPSTAGATDECVAGTSCSFGVCRDVCDAEEVGCGNDQACISLAGQDLQVCEATCDILAQAGCDAGEGCYLLVSEGVGLCSQAPGGGLAIGDTCMGFINECVSGAQCFDTDGDSNFECKPFCDTSTCSDAMGTPDQCGCSPCAADETCFPIGGAPPNVGVCAPAVDLGCDCNATPICMM